MNRILVYALIVIAIMQAGCKKETEQVVSLQLEDFAPQWAGKFISYQLDTFKYLPFSLKDTTISYQVKYLTDALVEDNLGRPAYRVIRYIRKGGLDAWIPDNTFLSVNTGNSLEFIENNLRFLKMKLPVREGYSWKGNTYIDTYSLNSGVRYLDDWDYTYEAVNEPATVGVFQLDSTIKVSQRDEVIGNPADANAYSEINTSSEIYAKGTGLVYRHFLHTEFQPATPGGTGAGYTDDSYGITLTMIDHN